MKENLGVEDEFSLLKTVVVGRSSDFGTLQEYNGTIRDHLRNGDAPSELAITTEVEGLCRILEDNGVAVVRPHNIPGVLQTFVRDLGFVVGDRFVWCNLKRPKRRLEQAALRPWLEEMFNLASITLPNEVRIEGGDVVLLGGRVLVGVGADPDVSRTGMEAVEYLKMLFPNREVVPIALNASDEGDPKRQVLHLDCAFQPLGNGRAVFYDDGFACKPEVILDLLGEANLIKVSGEEMFHLWPNLLSISNETIISSPGFKRMNSLLRATGLNVIETPYEQTGKLGGLFRCSTLPLRRLS